MSPISLLLLLDMSCHPLSFIVCLLDSLVIPLPRVPLCLEKQPSQIWPGPAIISASLPSLHLRHIVFQQSQSTSNSQTAMYLLPGMPCPYFQDPVQQSPPLLCESSSSPGKVLTVSSVPWTCPSCAPSHNSLLKCLPSTIATMLGVPWEQRLDPNHSSPLPNIWQALHRCALNSSSLHFRITEGNVEWV